MVDIAFGDRKISMSARETDIARFRIGPWLAHGLEDRRVVSQRRKKLKMEIQTTHHISIHAYNCEEDVTLLKDMEFLRYGGSRGIRAITPEP
ncbi:hypothetical protein PMAYCL1PPCAC_10511, partial [Pristionchus mayeri]